MRIAENAKTGPATVIIAGLGTGMMSTAIPVLSVQAGLIREELDGALLTRFDRLMERYGFAVSEVLDGVCQSCNINLSTQMFSQIEGSDDIYICENCGECLRLREEEEEVARGGPAGPAISPRSMS